LTLKPAKESERGHPVSATVAAFTSPCGVLFSSFAIASPLASSFANITADAAATAGVEGTGVAGEDTGAAGEDIGAAGEDFGVAVEVIGAVEDAAADVAAGGFDAAAVAAVVAIAVAADPGAASAGGSPDRTSNASGSSSESVTPPVEGFGAGLAGAATTGDGV
jgi:hypothetical protein